MTTTIEALDAAAHLAAQGPVRSTPAPKPQRRVLAKFQAGGPRGSWPAEEFAHQRRREGIPADVVMDLANDAYLVVVPGGERRD
ncbi:hypothetical protein [Streptomyces sp. NPDC001492]